jgi:TRAP-type C4-dicarboxylate transport system substrate-binding protein
VSLSIVGVFMLRKKLKVSVAGLCLLTAGLPLAGRAGASPKLISLVFSSSLQAPQQVGAERLRHQLMETVGNHFVVDERGGNSVGSENAILAATRAGSVDMAVLTASVVSSSVPALGVFDIPFLFRDAAHARAVAEGPAGAAIAAKFAEKGLVLLAIVAQRGHGSHRHHQSPVFRRCGEAARSGIRKAVRQGPAHGYQVHSLTLAGKP